MKARRIIAMGAGLLAAVWTLSAQTVSDYVVTADFADRSHVEISHEGTENGGWSLTAKIEYFSPVPRVVVRGSFVTRLPIDPVSHLSYHLFYDGDEVLLAEGRRSDWQTTSDGGMRADFEIDIPQVLERPAIQAVRISFDAVVEYEYWYRTEFPEIPFPEIRITNLPRRDHYKAGWVWIPRYLPAGFGAKIPTQFSVEYRDEVSSQFVPALDVNTVDGVERVPSKRVELSDPLQIQYRGWMPLDPLEVGTVMVRPGLVWENVRWYEGLGWFERQPVTFISPLLYAVLIWIGAIFWWWSLKRICSVERPAGRRLGLALWALFTIWFSGGLIVSGFWILVGYYGVISLCGRNSILPVRTRTYLATWSFLGFIEIYWSRLEGSVGMATSGIWLSLAVWAFLLLPLLAIGRDRLRQFLAFAFTLGWVGFSVAAVVYHGFFQDYPSVENLLYAGQLGELGDSVFSLFEAHHLLPFWGWFSGVAIFAGIGRRKLYNEAKELHISKLKER